MDSIPVIDLGELTQSPTDNPEAWKRIAGEIRNALSGIGFMYLKNHGISKKTISNAFQASSRFFNLPEIVKEKYRKNHAISGHGWVQPGQELLHPNSVFEIRECYDIVGLGPKRKYPLSEEHPNLQELSETLESEGNQLTLKLLKLLGLSLELEDADHFVKCCSHLRNPKVESECDLRLIYYPAIAKDLQIAPGTVRCAEHTDYEILTLLFQDDVGGLEVKNVEGRWIPARPIKDTILVNTGDLLEFWTNGFYPATFHRVIIPEEEIRKRTARYSIAYFFAPDNDTLITPLKSKYCPVRSATTDWVPVTAQQHIMKRVKEAYQY